ncbi:MAG: methyltransferase domain-containing protein [Anaerolineales bacterium]|jgi:SAM-dependent methyltransferase
MPLSAEAWHKRFQQQAAWTRSLRSHLYQSVNIASAREVLEVGCGTGVLTGELQRMRRASVYGLDLDLTRLRFAKALGSDCCYSCGDGHFLPFPDSSFGVCLCHYLLLWVQDPSQVLREMRRVTRKGGWVLVLAEPDYGGRIDHPPQLALLGEWQRASLRRQGALPEMGRRLGSLLVGAGLQGIQTGVIGGEWTRPPSAEEWAQEWDVLQADLEGSVGAARLDQLREKDRSAWLKGERVLFVPTFYGLGQVL